MGVRLARSKPRSLLASALYKINRFMPLGHGRKLDLMLDLAWVAHRLSIENAGPLQLNRTPENPFLHKGIEATDRVLEIGCSGGQVLSTVKAAERVGVDMEERSIELGKKLYPDITFIRADAREYLSEAGRFDVLILSHVLEHIDEPEAFLASVKNSFDRIYIEVPDFDWTDLNQIRLKRGRQLIYMDNDHIAEFDRNELEGIFKAVDLEVTSSEFRFGVMRYWLTASSPAERKRPSKKR
jgi:SAM-dependent methyltransferase